MNNELYHLSFGKYIELFIHYCEKIQNGSGCPHCNSNNSYLYYFGSKDKLIYFKFNLINIYKIKFQSLIKYDEAVNKIIIIEKIRNILISSNPFFQVFLKVLFYQLLMEMQYE